MIDLFGRFISVVLMAMTLTACADAAQAARGWRIEITTDGGITGRGLGNATITRESIAQCDHAAFDRALRAAKPSAWKRGYRQSSNPRGYADQILTTMTLTIGEKSHTTSWYTGARDLVPPDAIALFEAAWPLRTCGR